MVHKHYNDMPTKFVSYLKWRIKVSNRAGLTDILQTIKYNNQGNTFQIFYRMPALIMKQFICILLFAD